MPDKGLRLEQMNDLLQFLIILVVVVLVGLGIRAAWRRWPELLPHVVSTPAAAYT
jgi:hypothetical protein